MDERKEIPQSLIGEIYQVRRIDRRLKGAVHFADQKGLGIAIELPQKQTELISEYISKEPPERWHFWVCKKGTAKGWQGIVIGGPFGNKERKSIQLLSDAQSARWFNQFLTPLSEITRVEEINPIGKLSFKVGDKEVGFEEIWRALGKEERRKKEGEKKERQFEKEKRIPPRDIVAREARKRFEEIGES